MISHIAICISMDETTPFDGYLQINKGCFGIIRSVQLGTKSARTCRKILYFLSTIIFLCTFYVLNDATPFIKYFQLRSQEINKTSSFSLTFRYYPEY